MKLTKIMMLLFAVALILSVAACGKDKPKVEGEVVNFPEWWNSQDDEAYVCAYGMATKASQTMSIDAAKANALFEAAQYVETQVKGMLKNYEEEAGVDNPQVLALTSKVIKAVTDAEFSGIVNGKTQTLKVQQDNGSRFTTYMQIKIPKTEVNKALYGNIRNEEALYNQFKASEAFKELEYSTQNK